MAQRIEFSDLFPSGVPEYSEPPIATDSPPHTLDTYAQIRLNHQIPLATLQFYDKRFISSFLSYLLWLQSLQPVHHNSQKSKPATTGFAIPTSTEELEQKTLEEDYMIQQLLCIPEFAQFEEELEWIVSDLRQNIEKTRKTHTSSELQIGEISDFVNIALRDFSGEWEVFISNLSLPYPDDVLRIFKTYCFYKVSGVVSEGYTFIEDIDSYIQLLIQTGLTKEKCQLILEIICLLPEDFIARNPVLVALGVAISDIYHNIPGEVQAA